MGIWNRVEPRIRLDRPEWHFAHYIETPTERDDGQWYEALFYRDDARTRFGKIEFVGPLERRDFRAIADKVLKDASLRARHLSDDPDLPRLWRRR